MNAPEFSNEFDVLYNNITSNMAPGLNEYEKSVFLTQAQGEVISNHFNPKGNKYQEGFDDSKKRQTEFSELIKTSNIGHGITLITDNTYYTVDDRSKIYSLPSDVFIVLNESASVTLDSVTSKAQVIPLRYDEYTRLMLKPYKEPLKGQVWKLISGANNLLYSELIPKTGSTISAYAVRYVRVPYPIILENFSITSPGTTIEGKNTPFSQTEVCELNPIIHREILNRAVILAKAAYESDLKSKVELSNLNE